LLYNRFRLPYFWEIVKTVMSYHSLESLAATLRLPKTYLRDLAKSGTIPVLVVGGRLRFDVVQVQRALRVLAKDRASKKGQADGS
jgi:hypothetical protein